jgi:hypothetical protein
VDAARRLGSGEEAMRILLHRSFVLAAMFLAAAPASASPFMAHAGRVGGAHFAHIGAPGFRFHPAGRFAFGDFRGHGNGRFFRGFGGFGDFGVGGFGYFAPALTYDAPSEPSEQGAAQPYVASVGVGSAPATVSGYHGDCQIHRLIYGPDGRYVGQKVIEACSGSL